MRPEDHVEVDVRALNDLRSRVQTNDKTISTLRRQVSELEEELLAARNEAENTLQSAQAAREQHMSEIGDLRQQLTECERSREQLEGNLDQLGEALRRAQEAYWRTSQELSDLRQQLDVTTSKLSKATERVNLLEDQVSRIVRSRAWRFVTRYRAVVKRIRRAEA